MIKFLATVCLILVVAFPLCFVKANVDCGNGIVYIQGDLVRNDTVGNANKVVSLIQNLRMQCPTTPVLVLSTGDNEQESAPTLSNYQNYFGTTFGPYYFNEHIFKMVRGNHDVASGNIYFTYFGNPPLNYSFNFGNWHFIGLDQTTSTVNSTAQNFFNSDLETDNKCTLAYWHVPRFSSGSLHGDSSGLSNLITKAYDSNVDIIVNGHDHNYQRFYPINPDGIRDDEKGISTFIVGIGGQDGRSGSKPSIAQNASALYLDSFPGGSAIGTLQLTLHDDSLDFNLYNANDLDGLPLDSGNIKCHPLSPTGIPICGIFMLCPFDLYIPLVIQ